MITLHNLTKTYGSLKAVDGVSYTVEKGEFFALLGPNGAGKTTIVRMLMGFSRPTGGTITINGIPARSPSARRSVGYLAEDHRIPPYLTGWEYLLRCAALSGITGSDARSAAGRVVERVGMAGKEKAKARSYSKGMAQRIGIGAALLGAPSLLVLDEPVTGLDPIGIREIRNLLEGLNRDGVTIVLNSHLLSEVEKTCTSAAIIHKGAILVKDSIDAIVGGDESLEDVFIRYIEKKNG